jgi:hypothetical protein
VPPTTRPTTCRLPRRGARPGDRLMTLHEWLGGDEPRRLSHWSGRAASGRPDCSIEARGRPA